MEQLVLIHIEGGLPTVIGGTSGVRVFFLDYDSFNPHPSYYSQVVDVPMSKKQIIKFIEEETDATNNTNQ